MPLDTCICGSCEQTFTDLNEFILHKQEGCPSSNMPTPQEEGLTVPTPVSQGAKAAQLHINEAREITRLDSEPGHDAEESNACSGTMTFLSDVNLDTELDSLHGLDTQSGQGAGTDPSSSAHTLIILRDESPDPADARNLSDSVLSGLEGVVDGLSSSQLVSHIQDNQSGATTLVLSHEQFSEILRKQQQQQGLTTDGSGTSEPVQKKRRIVRAKKGEGKNKIIEAVPPSAPRPSAPETNADGSLSCPQCKRSFTKERHFNTHKCLASSSYVDISKKEIVKIDSDEDEGEKSLFLHLDDGAQEDDGDEYSAPLEENLRVEKEEEEDDEEMAKDDDEEDFGLNGKRRGKKRGRRVRSKANGQGLTTVKANAQQMRNAIEAMENLPIFKSEEEKVAFEACVDVDLSQTDNMFRVHVIEQELNEMSGMVYNTPSVSSLSVYSCTVCEKVFKSLSHIRLHCVTHTDMKPFKCNRCDYRTNSKGNLYTHMRKHTGQFYRCEKCDFKTVNKSHLIEHQMTHDSRRPQCMLCQKDYSTIKSLINHIRKYHTNKAGKDYLATFLSGRGMKGNMIIHQCHVCNRKFKKRIDRDRHLFIHDIKDIPNVQQCELCDYWASRRVYLDKHYLKHRVIYCCIMCELKFLSIIRLSEHLNSEHGGNGENSNLMSDSWLEECINRSYYLPEPLATSVEGSKYINLPDVLTELNPEPSQAANLLNLDFISDSNGSSNGNLPNALSSQAKDATSLNSTSINQDGGSLVIEGCAPNEDNLGPMDAATNSDPSYNFPSDYRDFMADNGKNVFHLDEISKADGSERVQTEDGFSELLKDAGKENSGDSNKDDSNGKGNPSDKSAPVLGQAESVGAIDKTGQTTNAPVPADLPGSVDVKQCKGERVSEAPPMALMLQNPGSDSDKEEDGMKSQVCLSIDKEDDGIGKDSSDKDAAVVLDGIDVPKKSNEDNLNMDKSDTKNNPISRSGDGKENNLKDDEKRLETEARDKSERQTKDERINTLIKRLGYRKMTFDIFSKMRETFGTEECEYCGRLFYNKIDHETHVRTHTGDKPFACTHCSFRSSTRDGLRRHSEKEHEKVAYQCKECDFLAPTRTRLWNHQLKHLGISGLSCPQCTSKFDSMKLLRAHLVNSHKDMDKDVLQKLTGFMRKPQGKMGRRSFKCPHCPRVFIRANSELQKHIWIHEGIKPFACPICTYACRSKNNLQAHMLRHSSEKPFSCSECGKEYKSKTALRWHVRSHKAGKLFKCDKCSYEAIQSSHLKRHMETHDVVKRFICKHCSFSANTLGYMKIHYAKHHKGQPFVQEESTQAKSGVTEKGVYKCLSCGYLFGNMSDLKRHLKIRHHVQMQDMAGMDRMQISEVEVVQYQETTPPAPPNQNLPEVTVAPLLQPSQTEEVQQINPQTDESAMPISTVNLIQQIFGMSQGESQVRVVSEDGEPLEISPETIIFQQDGQLLMTTASDSNNIVPGNQYVIQYFNPSELGHQESTGTETDDPSSVQHVTTNATKTVHLTNETPEGQGQPTQFIITADGQTQMVTSSAPAQVLPQADTNPAGQLVFAPGSHNQLVTTSQPQIHNAEGNSGSLIPMDGQNQQLLTSADGSQFVTSDFDSYSNELIISDPSISDGLDVTGVKSGQEQQAPQMT